MVEVSFCTREDLPTSRLSSPPPSRISPPPPSPPLSSHSSLSLDIQYRTRTLRQLGSALQPPSSQRRGDDGSKILNRGVDDEFDPACPDESRSWSLPISIPLALTIFSSLFPPLSSYISSRSLSLLRAASLRSPSPRFFSSLESSFTLSARPRYTLD